MRVPRWILLSIFLFVCLFMSWFVYERYADHPSLKHVASVMAAITTQETSSRQAAIREYLNKGEACASTGKESALRTVEKMRGLVGMLDSAKIFFNQLNEESHQRHRAEETFKKYQSFIARHATLLDEQIANSSKEVFNEYLLLHEQLLPEHNQTKNQNSVVLSSLMLEQSLTEQVHHCMVSLAIQAGNCDTPLKPL